MDEPTASLMQREQHLLFAVVRDLRASGVGIICISHRLEDRAQAEAITLLSDHPNLKLIMGICSPAVPGAAESVKQAGKGGYLAQKTLYLHQGEYRRL